MTRFARLLVSSLCALSSTACGGSPFIAHQSDASIDDSSDDGPTIILVVDSSSGGGDDGSPPSDGAFPDARNCTAPTSLKCGDTCVDPTLPANCGVCANRCPGAEAGAGHAICQAGECGLSCDSDSSTTLDCNGACVDPATDPMHCGGCTTVCPAPASTHGAATCSAASDGGAMCSVGCATAYHACGGDCLSNADTPSVLADPCVLSEAFGIFVAPAPIGSDSPPGDGSRLHPYATIGQAMDKAAGGTNRVYACSSAGNYTSENLVVGASRDGVSVYGGLECTATPATWVYNASKVAVAPAAAGYALRVSGLSKGVTFEDLAFYAQDANAAGASSIAVFVSGAQNVAFHRVTMVAGSATAAGANGASGGTSSNPTNQYSGVRNGKTATSAAGAARTTCLCADGSSATGGQGGGSSPVQAPGAGQPTNGGGMAGTNGASCNMAGGGGNGTDAPAGSPDTPRASHGTLSANGWSPATGAMGVNGKPGQGGGGGGNGAVSAGGGGGGACGGCGGVGGKPGAGGGSSFALLSYQSGVALVACTLTAGNAAGGGTGGSGEQGQAPGGGGGGFGVPPATGCSGGAGGSGAGGNGGQGGAGGLSLTVGYSGMSPSMDSSTATAAGSPGTGGVGGAAGPAASFSNSVGVPGANGMDGVAQIAPMAL